MNVKLLRVMASSEAPFQGPTFNLADIEQWTGRIVITGASGWIGLTTIHLLADAFGRQWVADHVHCFGSTPRAIVLGPDWTINQSAIDTIGDLDTRPTWLCHYAFLTKERVADVSEDDYRRVNSEISVRVHNALDAIGCDRIFLASSGAALRAEDDDAPHDLRLYGAMKRDDERRFADWGQRGGGRRAVIARIFNLSGPFINKHSAYALSSFILSAQHREPIQVRAKRPVFRAFVDARELITLAFAEMSEMSSGFEIFDSGGTPMEMFDIAKAVSEKINQVNVERASITELTGDHYFGNHERYIKLLWRHGLKHLPFDEQIQDTAAFLRATAS